MTYKTPFIWSLMILSLIGVFILTSGKALAKDEDLIEIKKELSGIKKELEEIKKILSKLRVEGPPPQPPAEAEVSIDDDPFMGKKDAPLTLIEFSDFQCPFCARFSIETLPLLKKEYIETGRLKLVFRDFPLGFHQFAQKAAEAVNCAGEQGKYWEMHDRIFQNQSAMKVEDLKGHARQINLNQDLFTACLESGKYDKEIKKDIDDGTRAGVTGTPTFFLGITGKNKQIKGGRLVGAQPFDAFKEQIETLLKSSAQR
ncbi:MAG: DsbA family protein [Nitrospirota bacterium]